MYYVYFIENRIDNKTYIGYTQDLKRRLLGHKDKKPNLIYYEAYKNKKDAYNREQKLKQRGQSIRWLKERVRNSLNE